MQKTCKTDMFVWSPCHNFTWSFFPFPKFLPFSKVSPFSIIPKLLYSGRFTWLHASEECLAIWVRMCSISRTTAGTGRTTSRMYLSRCWIRVFKSPWKVLKKKKFCYALNKYSPHFSCWKPKADYIFCRDCFKISSHETNKFLWICNYAGKGARVIWTEQEQLNFCSESDHWRVWILVFYRV